MRWTCCSKKRLSLIKLTTQINNRSYNMTDQSMPWEEEALKRMEKITVGFLDATKAKLMG